MKGQGGALVEAGMQELTPRWLQLAQSLGRQFVAHSVSALLILSETRVGKDS